MLCMQTDRGSVFLLGWMDLQWNTKAPGRRGRLIGSLLMELLFWHQDPGTLALFERFCFSMFDSLKTGHLSGWGEQELRILGLRLAQNSRINQSCRLQGMTFQHPSRSESSLFPIIHALGHDLFTPLSLRTPTFPLMLAQNSMTFSCTSHSKCKLLLATPPHICSPLKRNQFFSPSFCTSLKRFATFVARCVQPD